MKTLADLVRRIEKNSIPVPEAGCHLWINSTGDYARTSFNGKLVRGHRAVFEHAHGPIPAGMVICHKCDTPSCVNVDHLFLGTVADNNADKMRKGRHRAMRGIAHPGARISPDIVVRVAAATGTLDEIAATFGVSRSQVARIKKGRAWCDVARPTVTRSSGARAQGEPHRNQKLSPEQVTGVRGDLRHQRVIAAAYGVSQGLVSQIKRGAARANC